MRPSSVAMRNRSSFSRCSFSASANAQAKLNPQRRIAPHNPRSGVFMDRMGIAFSGLGVAVLCGPKIERRKTKPGWL